jgi:hypothetical protein
VHAIGCGLDIAGSEQLVYEGLSGVAGVGCEVCFRGVAGDGVGIVGEEVPEVEGVGSWTVYTDFAGRWSVS